MSEQTDLGQEARYFMETWRRWRDASEVQFAVPALFRPFRDIREGLSIKGLLAPHSRPVAGQMILRFAHGGPILLAPGGEIVFCDLNFARCCRDWYATTYGYAQNNIQILQVVE